MFNFVYIITVYLSSSLNSLKFDSYKKLPLVYKNKFLILKTIYLFITIQAKPRI